MDADPDHGRLIPPAPAPASRREVLRLAVPALGALAAEPLYVLADTAIVGHLGTPQLGGLGIASTVLLTVATAFIFLAYGTTGAVGRRIGAGDPRGAAHVAVQGLWLALGLGAVSTLLLLVAGPTLVRLLGGEGEVATNALVYLRISSLGLPALLVVMAGTGYLRGVQDARTPLVVAVGTAAGNLALQLVLIEGFGYGIGASALSTVVVQVAGAAVYVAKVVGAARALGATLGPDRSELARLGRMGRDLLVRTAALRLSFGVATAVAARIGVVPLAAHQVAFEIMTALSLVLDALAIAGQSLVSAALGAGDGGAARATGRRILWWGLLAGVVAGAAVLVLRTPLAGLFSDDPAVVALTERLLLWVALLQPVAGVVFAIDGVLIGAGDLRYLARAMASAAAGFVLLALGVLAAGWGVSALWAALGLLLLARLLPLLVRFHRGRWAVTGADHPDRARPTGAAEPA